MTKEQLTKLYKEHGIDVKKCDNFPTILETLPYVDGEMVVGLLSEEDKFQLLSRYLNDICVYEKNLLHFAIRIEKELSWVLESRGVDVNKKFKEDAKVQAELLEKKLQESKEKLQKVGK